MRQVVEPLQVLDLLWGDRVGDPGNPDHGEAITHRAAIASLLREIDAIVMKSLDGGRDAAATARSNASAAEAAERFGSDVRAARSKGRDGSAVNARAMRSSSVCASTYVLAPARRSGMGGDHARS